MSSHNGSVNVRVAAYRVAINGRHVHYLIPKQVNGRLSYYSSSNFELAGSLKLPIALDWATVGFP